MFDVLGRFGCSGICKILLWNFNAQYFANFSLNSK